MGAPLRDHRGAAAGAAGFPGELQFHLADCPARLPDAESRPAQPASIRGPRRVGFKPVSQKLRAVRLQEIPGVGAALSETIQRLHREGITPRLEALRAEVPAGVLELLAIPGLRPQKVLDLYRKLGITSVDELEAACRQDRLKADEGLRSSLSGQGPHWHRAHAAFARAAAHPSRRRAPQHFGSEPQAVASRAHPHRSRRRLPAWLRAGLGSRSCGRDPGSRRDRGCRSL